MLFKGEEIVKDYTLEPEHELRFEVDFGTTVKLKVNIIRTTL